MTAAGQHAEARPINEVDDPGGYDAYVIGSAAYMGSWLKDAAEFVGDEAVAPLGAGFWRWTGVFGPSAS